jgi:hypothetical protein
LRSDSLITLTSGKVSAWGDLSALGTNSATQGTVAQQPTLVQGGAGGHPYLLCGQGAYSQLAFPSNAFSALTAGEAFFVFSRTSNPPTTGSGGLYNIGHNNSVNSSTVPYVDGVAYDMFGSAAPKYDGLTQYGSTTGATVHNPSSGTTTWQSRRNGSLYYSTPATGVMFDAAQWLLASASTAIYLVGKFYEFVLFKRVLTAPERALVHTYIYRNYGIAGV